MSNIIQEALKNCTARNDSIPDILQFFADFINKYGIYLKCEETLSFKFLITGHGVDELGRRTHSVILKPPHESYGYFSEELANDKLTPFGGKSLANLLRNNGAKVTFDEKESKYDETYDHYLVEFTINE